MEDFYNKLYKKILSESIESDYVHREEQLNDRWLTQEQASRDQEITRLLKLYVSAYEKKVKNNPRYRLAIMIGCAVVIVAAIVGCGYITIKIMSAEEKNVADVIMIITAFGSVLGVLAGIVQIITKYVFPEDEEQYITEIVKSIQTNDLENKKVNIHANNPVKGNKE